MGEQGISEHAIRNQPAMRAAISASQIVTYDPKIVFGYVRELRAAGAFPYSPDLRRTRFQPAIDANIAAPVQLNADLLKSNPGGVRNTPHRDQDVAAIDILFSGDGAHHNRNLLSGSPTNAKQFGLDKNLNTLVAQKTPYFLRDIDILPSQELRAGFDDGHIAAKATISLCQFQAGISATDHDQVAWQIIELQSLDVRERLGRFQTWNVRNRRVRSDVEENFISRELTRASVVQIHLKSFRRHETSTAHDQFGAARAVDLQVLGNLTFHHLALAPTNRCHIDGNGTGHRTILPAVARNMGYFRTRNLVLARHASDVRTRTADPTSLHDGSLVP